MKEECRNIKRFLYELYPDEKFSIQYKYASNYIDSSDTIKIKVPYGINKKELKQYLYKYTIGIYVLDKSEYGAISGDGNSSIIIPSTNEVIDMDMVEFIEIM